MIAPPHSPRTELARPVNRLIRLLPLLFVSIATCSTALAQQSEIYIDEFGRRLLVDRDTGEIIARLDERRSGVQTERSRLNDLEGEVRELFGLNRDEQGRSGVRIERARPLPRQQRNEELGNRGFWLDQYGDRRSDAPAYDGPVDNDAIERAPLPAPGTQFEQPQTDVARLPDESAPLPNSTSFAAIAKPRLDRNGMTELQVFLDREGFSPGAVDGQWGTNVRLAVAAWQESFGQPLDMSQAALADALARSGGSAFSSYTITYEDEAGPFVAAIPVDYAEKAQMPSMAYTSMVEKLAEQFHMSVDYLQTINPGAQFRAGETITVIEAGPKVEKKVHYIIADKGRKQLRGLDRNGHLVVAYPATIGSSDTPSPTGTHTVERTAVNPEYLYNPKINFQQGENTGILKVPPGPNGPVGSVWIALSKPTYGIHGTPDPEKIGKTNSHGCIRLTNWDALELVKLVAKGTVVEFIE